MALFLSTFCNKIDKKGRVSVPASFRAALAEQSFHGIVAFRSLTLEAVEGVGMDRMEQLSEYVDGLELISEQSDWVAAIFSDAQQLAFDGEGRVTLPEILLQHADIQQEVAFVGRGTTFQLWNPEKFHHYQKEARQRLLESKTPLGGLRPKNIPSKP